MDEETRNKVVDYVRNENYYLLSLLIFNEIFLGDKEAYAENFEKYMNNPQYANYTITHCKKKFAGLRDEKSIMVQFKSELAFIHLSIIFNRIK